jgi:hypothetical protein
VDGILENRHGQVIGIEVKAASTVRSEDFNGLRQLSARLGDDGTASPHADGRDGDSRKQHPWPADVVTPQPLPHR